MSFRVVVVAAFVLVLELLSNDAWSQTPPASDPPTDPPATDPAASPAPPASPTPTAAPVPPAPSPPPVPPAAPAAAPAPQSAAETWTKRIGLTAVFVDDLGVVGPGTSFEWTNASGDRGRVGLRFAVDVPFTSSLARIQMYAAVKGELDLSQGTLRPFVALGGGFYGFMDVEGHGDAGKDVKRGGMGFVLFPQLGVDVAFFRLAVAYHLVGGHLLGSQNGERFATDYLALEIAFIPRGLWPF